MKEIFFCIVLAVSSDAIVGVKTKKAAESDSLLVYQVIMIIQPYP